MFTSTAACSRRQEMAAPVTRRVIENGNVRWEVIKNDLWKRVSYTYRNIYIRGRAKVVPTWLHVGYSAW